MPQAHGHPGFGRCGSDQDPGQDCFEALQEVPQAARRLFHAPAGRYRKGAAGRSAAKLETMGVRTAWDFACLPGATVRKLFALPGYRTWRELHSQPCIEFEHFVEPKQSICVSRSFSHDLQEAQEFGEQITTFAGKAAGKLRAQSSLALEMIVFAMTNRFKADQPQSTAGILVPFPEGTCDYKEIVSAASTAARNLFRSGYAYKKGGVVFTKIVPQEGHGLSLFADAEALEKESRLSESIDSIQRSFGSSALLFGVQGDGLFHMAQDHKSPHYTTRWSDIPTVTVK